MGVPYRSAVTHTSGALWIGDAPPLLFARLGRFGPRVRAPIAKWYLGAQQVDQPARDQPRGRAGPPDGRRAIVAASAQLRAPKPLGVGHCLAMKR